MSVERCERLVVEAVEASPLVRLLLRGLARAGCPLALPRHVACETLRPGLLGGFDRQLNQVVVCAEKCRTAAVVERILAHELVHMYDQCAAGVDWADLRHLACSEVRAANLAHCPGPLAGALADGAALWGGHRACVRGRAVSSVAAVGGVGREEAEEAVAAVFERCYADLEPVGRRCWGRGEQGRAEREEQWNCGRGEGGVSSVPP